MCFTYYSLLANAVSIHSLVDKHPTYDITCVCKNMSMSYISHRCNVPLHLPAHAERVLHTYTYILVEKTATRRPLVVLVLSRATAEELYGREASLRYSTNSPCETLHTSQQLTLSSQC